MEKNLSKVEALARVLIGSLLFIYLIIGGPWWAVIGVYFMLSGCFRFCLLYFYLLDRNI